MPLPDTFPACLVMRGGELTPGPGAAPRPRPGALRRCASDEELRAAPGDACRLCREAGALVIRARIGGQAHRLAVTGGEAVYRGPRVRAYWKADGWTLTSAEPAAELAEGERIDLSPCAALIAEAMRAEDGGPV
ncbi:MAG TPA: hypothetical protein VMS93_07525 [Candidatus Saccharimonadales bacterium]|nr:hypothetical protein [Candidatus Saccharimonadales bacterium]